MAPLHSSSLFPPSFHPILSVSLPPSFLHTTTPTSCSPYLLLSLPPALLLDPWEEPVCTALYRQSDKLAQPSTPHRSSPFTTSSSIAIDQITYLATDYPAQDVQVEKAVGWLQGREAYIGRGIWQGRGEQGIKLRGEGAREPGANGSGGGSQQHSQGGKQDMPNRERDSILLRLSISEVSPKWNRSTLKLPLHARYLSPVESSLTTLASRLLFPEGSGNYIEVGLEGLDVFWACNRNDSPEQAEGLQWESLPRASSLLPATHSHLASALISSLPSKSALFRPHLVSSTFLPEEEQSSQGQQRVKSAASTTSSPPLLPSILLPTGDASLAELTWGITQAVIWIVAVWILMSVRSLG